MRAVIQRVSEAHVTIDGQTKDSITKGLLVFVGIEQEDKPEDLQWLSNKIVQLRIFSDENGLMNRSLAEVDGNILLISQFTLFASTKKGNRPSFLQAAKPETAIPLYNQMIITIEKLLHKKIGTGIFGADMKVFLVNDGPVTILIDTKNKQ